jgi:hypothetical protein
MTVSQLLFNSVYNIKRNSPSEGYNSSLYSVQVSDVLQILKHLLIMQVLQTELFL